MCHWPKVCYYLMHCSLVQEKLIEEPGLANVETTLAPGSSIDARIPEYPSKSINRQIALVSAFAAVGLFLSTRLDLGVSLKDLTAVALPYEEVCLLSTLLLNLCCVVPCGIILECVLDALDEHY